MPTFWPNTFLSEVCKVKNQENKRIQQKIEQYFRLFQNERFQNVQSCLVVLLNKEGNFLFFYEDIANFSYQTTFEQLVLPSQDEVIAERKSFSLYLIFLELIKDIESFSSGYIINIKIK